MRTRAPRRRAFTLVEGLVAAGLAALVLGGAAAACLALQRQSRAVTAHAAGQRGLALARARLQADLAAMVPLEDPTGEPFGVRVEPGGEELRFRSFAPSADPDQPPGGPSQRVTWEALDTPGGEVVLVRRAEGASGGTRQAFPEIPLKRMEARVVLHAAQRFVEVELEVGAPDAPGTLVRVARALPRESRIPGWRVGPTPAEFLAAAPPPTGSLPTLVLPPVHLRPY